MVTERGCPLDARDETGRPVLAGTGIGLRAFFDLIGEDFRTYRRPFLQQGYWSLLIHRYGMLVRGISFKPLYYPLRFLHLLLIKVSEILFGIYLGPDVTIGRRLLIEHFGCIIINAKVVIGDDVRLRHEVTIGNLDAANPDAVPVIADGVDIGAGAKILGPILVGAKARIGANAVVNRDVPSGATAVGVPARIIAGK